MLRVNIENSIPSLDVSHVLSFLRLKLSVRVLAACELHRGAVCAEGAARVSRVDVSFAQSSSG